MAKPWRARHLLETFELKRSLALTVLFLVIKAVIIVFIATSVLSLIYIRKTTGRFPSARWLLLYIVVTSAVIAVFMLTARIVIRRRIMDPVRRISETAENYALDKSDGTIDDFYFGSLKLKTGDELEELSLVLAAMEQDIADSEQKLLRATAERQRISTELSVANDIQSNMLPNIFPPFPDRKEFEIYARMDPAKEVGGDFFDFMMIDDTHLGLVMADVSGKGIPAALFMMSSMIIIENYANLGYSPKEVLEMSNSTICAMELVDMFVTVWFGILDLKTGVVTAANAGHEYPAFMPSGEEYSLMKSKHGFVVGGMDGIKYHEYTFTMEPGSSLFLYTDGVPEAVNKDLEAYGTERMVSALNRNRDLPPKELLGAVRSEIDGFVKDAAQFDDLTMMSVKYLGPQ